ncbi:MAG: AAA family ATPase [Lachnospiraceae bacterium]|nr:AAA family ATPase [Lachnospiraceae bacterium]
MSNTPSPKNNPKDSFKATSRPDEESHLEQTLAIVRENVDNYGREAARMNADIEEMLRHYHDNDVEVYTILNNTITMHDHMKRALVRNEKALSKPYFGRIIFHDESVNRDESIYIGKGGIAKDTTHQIVTDWRAPIANVYYENGLGKCSYTAPDDKEISIDLKLKRTYEIEDGKLLDYYDTEVVANDDLLTKYLAKNKQAVLGEIIATIQKEQNDIIRKSPYHNIIVQGVAGSGKTTVAMHRISYILYNYEERFKPDDFYIVGSNRILLNYITGVLPDLDVHGIRQMTMEQLFVRLLYEDWDEQKYHISDTDKMSLKGSIKGTLQWFRDLENYCERLEWNTIPRESIFLNRKQFVEGIRNGKTGVFDETNGKTADPKDLTELLSQEAIERYIKQNPTISVQSKIDMLNDRLINKIKDEFLGKGISLTEKERKAILKAYRGRFGTNVWKKSIYNIYHDFLAKQTTIGLDVDIPTTEFDVYDLAALAYIYKRIKETEVISEAHHIVIDEAQDFGMMAYSVLKYCIKDCTYTIMGDISQNIHFGYGLNDWEELKKLILSGSRDSFGILKKSYRNTIEISEFATNILHHGQFSIYPVEPIIRHGSPVQLEEISNIDTMLQKTALVCKEWQQKGLETIAVVCRNRSHANETAKALGKYVNIMESDLENAVFGAGIMVLPVDYTKGLEFDAVLIFNPTRDDYPVDDGHAKLLYVAATRALHELCILHTGNLTGLIADPLPDIAMTNKDRLNKSSLHDSTNGTSLDSTNNKASAASGIGVTSRKKVFIAQNRTPEQSPKQTAASDQKVNNIINANNINQESELPEISFGDMPATEKLRPSGHSKIDLSIRWVTKQKDGLYMQSRYGILRLSPVGSAIIRVTFVKGKQPDTAVNSKIAVSHIENTWMYKETGSAVELKTDELCIQVDKNTGAIRYLTRDKKLLLAERSKECRQIADTVSGRNKAWLFLDWQKDEKLYGMGTEDVNGINLRNTARYISHGKNVNELPFILSDKGYGILMATDKPTICCDVPAYGSYLCAENESQIDFYFITGKQPKTIMNAYAYLCGMI